MENQKPKEWKIHEKQNFIRQKCIEAKGIRFNKDGYLPCPIQGCSRRSVYRFEKPKRFKKELRDGRGSGAFVWYRCERHAEIVIRLADVLLAMGCNTYTLPKDRFHYGDLLFSGDSQSGGRIIWNLLTDDLEKQDEQTINFVFDLVQ